MLKFMAVFCFSILLQGCTGGQFEPVPAPQFLSPSAAMQEEIELAFFESEAELRPCYETQLQKKPGLQGKIVVTFVLDDQGEVFNPSYLQKKSSLEDQEVNACVFAKLRNFDFPIAPPNKLVAVEYELLFFPEN